VTPARSTVIVRQLTFSDEAEAMARKGVHDTLGFVEVLLMFECGLARREVAPATRENGVVEAVRMGTSIRRPNNQDNASLLSSSRLATEGPKLVVSPAFGEAKAEEDSFVGGDGARQFLSSPRLASPKWSKMVIRTAGRVVGGEEGGRQCGQVRVRRVRGQGGPRRQSDTRRLLGTLSIRSAPGDGPMNSHSYRGDMQLKP